VKRSNYKASARDVAETEDGKRRAAANGVTRMKKRSSASTGKHTVTAAAVPQTVGDHEAKLARERLADRMRTEAADYSHAASEALESLRRIVLVDSSDAALVLLALHANQAIQTALKQLQEQEKRARVSINMEGAAWLQIYDALWRGVSSMNRHAMKHPKLFEFAAESCYWPFIKSPGIGFIEGEPDEKKIFRQLKVGQDLLFMIANTKWKPNDAVGQLAVELLQDVFKRRLFPRRLGAVSAEDREAAEDFRKRAATLSPFKNDEAWQQWWTMAEEILIGVGMAWLAPSLPPNRTGPSRAYGSPVGGVYA
jgi:hypothetical protein